MGQMRWVGGGWRGGGVDLFLCKSCGEMLLKMLCMIHSDIDLRLLDSQTVWQQQLV